jgi:DNA-binding XRE family transcriptional regulator
MTRETDTLSVQSMMENEPTIMALAKDTVRTFNGLLSDLVALRIAKGLTQAEVAQRMGAAEEFIVELETHDANPTLIHLARYAHALHAKVSISVSDSDETSS